MKIQLASILLHNTLKFPGMIVLICNARTQEDETQRSQQGHSWHRLPRELRSACDTHQTPISKQILHKIIMIMFLN